ncbi:MAG: aminotransferase class I/II-fold pyridoxal phosphate-dependent enzyme [Candidatus Aureabacteria bacterium]|nr:aminotransferase class I/II-fold pyridoxal phosphate-dependent enzyme [Candidatus Auribacterota bacterium]
MPIAHRMRGIDSSGIRKAFDLARQLDHPIDLSIGQPDFDPPPEIIERAREALGGGFNRYTLTQGIEELRSEVRQYLREKKGFDPEEVIITSGAAGGIMLAFLALVNPGERVAIPDPYFVIYKHLCTLVGGAPVYVDTYPDFALTAERLEKAIGKKSKLLIFNNPCNPTGALVRRDEMKAIAELAEKVGAVILSDEVYDFFTYDNAHESMGKHSDSALVLGGYSKTFGIPGWRIGYAAGPKKIIEEMVKLQQYSYVCAPSVLQHAVLGALDLDMHNKLDDYRKKRDMVYEGLRGSYACTKPGGAFYLFPGAPGGSGEAFVRKAIEKNLILVPGSVFSERDSHFRLSFAAPDEVLIRAIEVLRKLVA